MFLRAAPYTQTIWTSVVPPGYTYQGPSPTATPHIYIEGKYQSGQALVDPGFKYLGPAGPDHANRYLANLRRTLQRIRVGMVTHKRIYKKSTKFLLNQGVP